MKSLLRILLLVLATLTLATCGTKFKSYNGPTVTLVEVHKADRRMYLLHGSQILKVYKIHLGGNPIGPKQFEGDGKTPEGGYVITHRNPNSAYHLSLGISYPNDADREFAKAADKLPGGISSSMVRTTRAHRAATGPSAASPFPTARSKRSMRWSSPEPRSTSFPEGGFSG